MSDVVFCRTRYAYDSYRDYWTLVELNGYPTCYIDEIPRAGVRDKTFILTPLNGEWENGVVTDGRVILWQFEWNVDGAFRVPSGVSEVWAPDAWFATCIQAKYVPLGGDARLNPEPDATREKRYDVAMLSYMVNRRQEVAAQLQGRGLTLAPNGWFDERHETLLASRVMCHVHQHGHIPAVAAQRFVLAAAYGLPLFTETLADVGIFDHHRLLMTDHVHYAEFVAMWLKAPTQRLVDLGQAIRHLLTVEYPFRRCIEAAV